VGPPAANNAWLEAVIASTITGATTQNKLADDLAMTG
jgi:hypothetical protein